MNSSKVTLFFEVCRLCLDRPGECNIFETASLRKDIYSCTKVKVFSSENLPQKICRKCLDIVVNAKELKVLALKNDSYMRSLFNSDSDGSNNESKEDIMSSPNNNRTVKSTYFNDDDDKPKNEKNQHLNESISPTSSNIIRVRKDLFKSTAMRSSTKERKFSKDNQSPSPKMSRSSIVEKTNVDGNLKKNIVEKTNVDVNPKKKKESNKEELNEVKTKKPKSENLEEPYNVVKYKRIEGKNSDAVKFECGVCKKQFDKWKKFYLHQRSHNKSILCPLDMCGKKFTTKGDLEKHIRSHTGERPYQCSRCDKSFTQRGTLKSHTETVHFKSVDCDVVID